ncbi:unnamed protein product [Euphydryas editha]|uniref:CCHC-type domain-containing protein n=1 Tax=Euphydryas editha TaxID=104508 RepID=A0AAU9U5D5_EUPED|nr:unnamed protein product [Euphydryas editha]
MLSQTISLGAPGATPLYLSRLTVTCRLCGGGPFNSEHTRRNKMNGLNIINEKEETEETCRPTDVPIDVPLSGAAAANTERTILGSAEIASTIKERDAIIAREDLKIEEIRDILKATLELIKTKRTVPTEVTKKVKETYTLLLTSLVHRKEWKNAQWRIVLEELKVRTDLQEQIQEKELLLQQTRSVKRTPPRTTNQRKRPAMSPPQGPEEDVSVDQEGNFTLVTRKKKKVRITPTTEVVQTETAECASLIQEDSSDKVKKKRKKKKKNDTRDKTATVERAELRPNMTGEPGTKWTTVTNVTKKPKRKQRSNSVLITPGENRSSCEVLKALRSKLCLGDLAIGVRSVRNARKGGLLIEFQGSVKDRSALAKRITEAAGESVAVRHLVPTTTVVINGLDAATTVEEVKASLGQSLGDGVEQLKVNITKPNKWGAVRAFVKVELTGASTLEALGKVKVGWLICRIRRWERLGRCFRCHGPGHMASTCKAEVDRSRLCWRCGRADHQSRTCTNRPRKWREAWRRRCRRHWAAWRGSSNP